MTPTTTTISKLFEQTVKTMKRGARTALLAFVLNLVPVPASRPRVGRFGTYYGKNYERFRKVSETLVADCSTDFPALSGPLEVAVEAVIVPPKNGKYAYPKSNGDVDNLAKGPLDAMTKAEEAFWDDDSQIVALHMFKRYADDGEEPKFRMYWREIDVETDD